MKRGREETSTSGRGAEEETLPVLDPVINFEKINRIGEGTYGVVYKARDLQTGEIVALKKLRMDRERDGMPVTSVRELRVLQSCHHPNLVQLKKIVTGSKLDSVFLVFEYCAHDLGRLLDSMPQQFSRSEVKCLLQQLLEGVAFLHHKWVFHRDLKLSNILLTDRGQLKLCDFGLARYFQPFEEASYTPRVVTLWYRAPEVLLGSDTYTEALDMWAVGCIAGELLRHEPLFPGKTEAQMIDLIVKLLGAPNDRIWPGYSSLPNARHLKYDQPYSYLKKEFSDLSAAGLDFLNSLLTYDPEKRLSARQALRHPWFTEHPWPKSPEDLRLYHPDQYTKDTRIQRERRRADQEQGAGMKRRYADRFGDVFGGIAKPGGGTASGI